MSNTILELQGVNKSFGPIDVLYDISLKVRAGEVLCLLGDNGAGKSTLIKILSGVHQPTSGAILMDGQPVSFPTPRAAAEKGIATVHQFGGTFPLMSIGRSFFVGVEPTKGWGPFKVYDRKTANAIAVKAVQDMGITRITDGDRLVGGLSGGERQSLSIARAVHFGARVLILDEPTAALGVKQATHVLRIVNEAKRRGLAVVFITHQVMHAMAVGDHFAVLIRGAVAADFKKGEKTREEITDLMAGGASMATWKLRSMAIWPATTATRPSLHKTNRHGLSRWWRKWSGRDLPFARTAIPRTLMMTVRIAVIGAGLMGADHARIVAEDMPGAGLQVVCDMDAGRAAKVAGVYGAEYGNDPEAAISRADVDAVIIASPDFTHAPLSLACIKAGKRVLCEKPLSQSSAECLTVMQVEQSAGARFVQLGFMRRYDEAYAQMKAALDAGRLGRALMMHNFHRNVATPASDFTGAMAITNSAPHEFDVVRHVLGTEYTSISATQPKRSDALVAPVCMTLETVDGQVVTIEINNNAAYGYDVRAELVGEAASIALNPVAYTRLDAALTTGTAYDPDWRSRYREAYVRQNRAFLRFVQTGVYPEIASSAWDGYASAIVAEAGVRALASGQKTPVTIIAKPELYA